MFKSLLEIKNLFLKIKNKQILNDLSLKIKTGEIHVLMGPNGSGKTSLAMAIAGAKFTIHNSQFTVDGKEIIGLTPNQRSKLGIFMCFQKPVDIPGVSIRSLLELSVEENFEEKWQKAKKELKIKDELLERPLENFSGGERKLLELFQAKVLQPKLMIFDEIDSGLDIEKLRLTMENLRDLAKKKTAIILITHNPRVLKFLKPTAVHILISGKIVKSGHEQLIKEIEQRGYQWLTKN